MIASNARAGICVCSLCFGAACHKADDAPTGSAESTASITSIATVSGSGTPAARTSRRPPSRMSGRAGQSARRAATANQTGVAPDPGSRGADAGAGAEADNYRRCYEGFRPGAGPELDVQRLAMMCGPSNGMHQYLASGDRTLNAEGPEPQHSFSLKARECYRVFVAGDSSIDDLEVEVLGPTGESVALANQNAPWVIAGPDGPLCADDAGQYTAVVRAHVGDGRYALEVWRHRGSSRPRNK